MALEERDFEKISNFIQEHLSEWLSGQSLAKPPLVYEIELRERIVRVEEELKNQRELMKQGFDMMEKRFEQVEKRFEQVDKRFEQVDKRFEELRIDMNNRFEQIDRRLFQFMIWSFTFTASIAGIVIAVLKLS